MALDILTLSKEDSPSKRREKPASNNVTKEGPLSMAVAGCQQLSSEKDMRKRKREEQASDVPTSSPGAVQEKCSRFPRDKTEGSSERKPSAYELRPLPSRRELDTRSCHTSRTKTPGTKDAQLKKWPKASPTRKSPRFSKEAERCCQGEEGSGENSNFSLPGPEHLPRTSTPNNPLRSSCTRKNPDAKTRLKKNLLDSLVECGSAKLPETRQPSPKKRRKASGRRYTEDSQGTRLELCDVAQSPSQGKPLRSSPKNSNCGAALEEPVLEPLKKNQSGLVNTAQSLQSHDLEDGEGLGPTSELPLSPPRESSVLGDEEDDEELPSILLNQEPCSIEAGMLVWSKLWRYPYWPAVVKRVERKAKRASVLPIEKDLANEKSKGICVSLRNLKHFDCEEKQVLIDKAREEFSHEINWCIGLIKDYRIKVGLHCFTGSFLEYYASDMSYPVRKEAQWQLSQMAFPRIEMDLKGSLSGETPPKPTKKVLPDRMRAARDKANEKIVKFIVKAKGAEEHLKAILKSKKPSRWLKQFLNAPPYVTSIETYLEDDSQQDLVFNYLREVYQKVSAKMLRLRNGDSIQFILDVLFPEAIIYAISAVDRIDYKKAEEKYIRGPLVSQREREIFEEEILEKKRKQHLQESYAEDSL
ncbi:PWWP domain-containing DNA repair factor 3A isoform X2 [Hemicordylus capensis]|nr:PWWP domain-containing DNA repair factor 3A isoform X2 [Hemicordylus capensis]XP_053145556.1 PWWP domain-containing DNA repair factor 3A isoform X2 [Hemicordylus capensis]XP_053145557.1 PWWP domain-containing DNA repair factor 3A isoform X2 [Hemicordylus capensis]